MYTGRIVSASFAIAAPSTVMRSAWKLCRTCLLSKFEQVVMMILARRRVALKRSFVRDRRLFVSFSQNLSVLRCLHNRRHPRTLTTHDWDRDSVLLAAIRRSSILRRSLKPAWQALSYDDEDGHSLPQPVCCLTSLPRRSP